MSKRQEAVRGPVLPHGKLPEPHQPTEGALDLPAMPTEVFARLHAASRNSRGDAAGTAGSPTPPGVVSLVRMQVLRSASEPTAFTVPDAVHGIQHGFELTRVMDVRARQGDGQRQAFSVDQQMQLTPGFAAVGGVASSVLTAARSGKTAAVQSRSRPIELIVPGRMMEHVLKQDGPEALSLPAMEGTFTGDTASESEGSGQLPPAQSPAQDVQNASEDAAWTEGWATPTGSRWEWRNQRKDQRPQPIRDQLLDPLATLPKLVLSAGSKYHRVSVWMLVKNRGYLILETLM